MDLKITNFQAIKGIELDIDGFVVIKGKSNSGKSSIRRAINSLFFNEWDKSFVRNGTKKTELYIEHNNNSIKLTKPNNSYEVNGDVFPKVGIKVPDEVSDLGIKFFETEAETINLIAPSQLDPLFMISYSDQINTRILNKIFNVQKYRLASAKAKKDNDNNTRDMKTLKADISDNKSEHSLEQSKLDKALEMKEIIDKSDSIDRLTNSITEFKEIEQIMLTVNIIIDNLNKLVNLLTYEQYLDSLNNIKIKIVLIKMEKDIIEDSLSVSNINILLDLLENLSNIEKHISNNMLIRNKLEEIEKIMLSKSILIDMVDYNNYTESIEQLNEEIDDVDKAIIIVGIIDNNKSKIKKINSFISDNNSFNSINMEMSDVDIKLSELQDKIKLVPICEFCGSQLHL